MLQWIKDWAPIVATIGALLGVIVTVRSAGRTYQHGLLEKRKDRQRELLADLIADTQQWCDMMSGAVYPALAKMSEPDILEFATTDSANLMGQLGKSVRVGLVKCLSEISDVRLSLVLMELELQRSGLLLGDEAAPLFDPTRPDRARFQALLVVLRRISQIERTCSQLQLAVIQSLAVEIEARSTWQALVTRYAAARMRWPQALLKVSLMLLALLLLV
ncbi:hypothetical protein [Mycobacteroides abscessus]|uniref:hypothetical protein n=1 Tax=Mycobacteroides abscessus TaxID=36809 RepID=UPI0002683829|nr:hypothetical protein [Mycobacteroides abscessus]EIT90421.1 hypothetical protein MA4S0303_4226 [Mycobacteroides abscessus 4S-0303]EIT92418.1 hypothetical protein MA4S0726RB_3754 [Mycobacteroides abscessus 4S-0726-RB]EIT95968.1 hypothetical protein MA4S0726RA_4165 [Mycobacteroides abscessus 4S-0726-RA]EIV08443.1 hypothetical protein MA4S0206_4239 [Mycobacteroides abscessus 4S-0206]EIV48534.1 hypothetical protein MA4S0116R_4194 [Mycobacteroides abscessus 4S-0116-R]